MKVRSRVATASGMILAGLAVASCGPKSVSFNVEMTDFKFAPAALEAPAGADVTLTLSNLASVEHEWVLFEAGYQVTLPFDADDEDHIYWEGEVQAGETATFTFVAPAESGVYQVVCGIPGHAEAGMLGTFTVP
jgi:uncharacterized cupredoxin-like copper-binding protein